MPEKRRATPSSLVSNSQVRDPPTIERQRRWCGAHVLSCHPGEQVCRGFGVVVRQLPCHGSARIGQRHQRRPAIGRMWLSDHEAGRLQPVHE